MAKLTVKESVCKMAEYDLLRNIDKGAEYTDFNGLYCDGMMEKKHVFQNGHVYDITDYDDSTHLLSFFEKLIKEEEEPQVIMTSGSFFSMNEKLQKKIAYYLIELSDKGTVRLYVGEENILKLFSATKVQVKVFDRERQFIPHFIKTKQRFNFALPHTEKKSVRVDINSDTFEPQIVNRILAYFDKLVSKLDEAININNRVDNNARAAESR
jgi:hypothetical protein